MSLTTSAQVGLAIRVEARIVRARGEPGRSVRELLDGTDLRVRAACGGTGSCGACVVRLLSGEVNPPTLAERLRLTPEDRARGLRLACQLRLRGDAEIGLDEPAPPSPWRSVPARDLPTWAGGLPGLAHHVLGVAIDLGTTHLRVALWDRRRGRRIATREGLNPQRAFGADVLNRLGAAEASPARGRELAALAREAILDAVCDVLARDVGAVTPALREIGQVIVVGNSAMLALLTGQGGAALLDPDRWQRAVDCGPPDLGAWRAAWAMPNADIHVAPPVAGFVGSDLSSDLLATSLTDGPGPALLLDVGTNTEIALWDGRTLHVTSVPGGPAFEGGTSRGMGAEPGAVFRVRRGAAGGAEVLVVGGGEAVGICGSGLVDAIALLLADGRIRPSGRLATPAGTAPGELRTSDGRACVEARDVDAFQRAKAATAAATAVLLDRAGRGASELRRLCVCGAFGATLDVGHAQALGLLPPVPPGCVELHGAAALAGCERALLSPDGAGLLAAAARLARPVNLALVEGYDDRFVEHLRLGPVPAG